MYPNHFTFPLHDWQSLRLFCSGGVPLTHLVFCSGGVLTAGFAVAAIYDRRCVTRLKGRPLWPPLHGSGSHDGGLPTRSNYSRRVMFSFILPLQVSGCGPERGVPQMRPRDLGLFYFSRSARVPREVEPVESFEDLIVQEEIVLPIVRTQFEAGIPDDNIA